MLLKRGEGCFLRVGGKFLSCLAALWTLFYIDISKRASGPPPSCRWRSFPSFTAMLLKRSEGRFFPSRRLFLAFFFDRAEGDLMPSDRAAARSLPSFTEKQFRSWRRHDQLPFEGTICPAAPCCFGVAERTFLSLLAGLWTLFYRRFKASKWATTYLRFEKPSVLHCHAVILKRGEGRFLLSWRLLLAFFFDRAEGDLMPSNRAAARSLPSFTAILLKLSLSRRCVFEPFGWPLNLVL